MPAEPPSTGEESSPPARRVFRSAAAAIAIAWSMRVIGLASVLVLARVLTPRDFGIVALATSVLSLVDIFSALGLRQALLRIPRPDRGHYDTAWTIQLIVLTLLAGVVAALAPLAAWFYAEPQLGVVIVVLASCFVIDGFINIGVVDFDRNLELGRDLRMRLTVRLATFVVTVGAALILRNYWALVVGAVLNCLFRTGASYVFHPYRPRLSLVRRQELLGVSWWMFLAFASQTVQNQFERIIVGRVATMRVLGFYSVSKDLSSIFTQEIATALNRVTFVTTAQTGRPLSCDPHRLAPMLGAYALIAAPLGLGLTATAPQAAAVLLGPQWVGAAHLLALIAPACALYAVYNLVISTLQAAGKARKAGLMALAGAGLMVASTGAAALLGAEVDLLAGVALAVAAVVLTGGVAALGREASMAVRTLVTAVLRPFMAALLMMLVLTGFGSGALPPLAALVLQVGAGAVLYTLFAATIWIASGRPVGAERALCELLGKNFPRIALFRPYGS